MRRFGLALLTTVTLGACAPDGLYVASETVLGVYGGVNTAKKSGWVQIGYDRQFAAIVPRSVEVETGQSAGLGGGEVGPAREAMSALGCTHMEVNSIFLTKFKESLATGRAARTYAKTLKDGHGADTGIFSCMH